MPTKTEPFLLPPDQVRRAWRFVVWAGLLGSLYGLLCIGGAPRIKYLTDLKATAFDFGLMAGFGAFAIGFQIVGSVLVNRLQRRKPAWMAMAILHRFTLVGMLVAPFAIADERLRMAWIIAVFFVHDAMANTGVPIWLSWMADLLPREVMNQRWASRQKFITAATMIFMILLAYGFSWFERRGMVIPGYTIIALVGIVLGVLDILLFRWVPEPPHEPLPDDDWRATIVQPLKDREFRPFLKFLLFWHFAIFLGAPFFGLFMMEDLKMSAQTVQLLGIPSALGVVVTSHFFGLLCDTYGYRPVLKLLALGKALTPLFFALTPRDQRIGVPFLALMMFFDGTMNAGVALAVQGMMLKHTPRRNRAMYIGAANFLAIGSMAALAPVIAGRLIDMLNRLPAVHFGPYQFGGYHWIFIIGFVLRLAAVPLAGRIREPSRGTVGEVWRRMLSPRAHRVTHLVYRLHDAPDPTRRLRIVWKLADLRDPMAISGLIHALKDPAHSVRSAAADALGRIGTGEAAATLARALTDPDSDIRSPAARALGKIGNTESLKALLGSLRSQDPETLGEIVESLGSIGDSAAILPLICLLDECRSPVLHRRIAAALAKLGDTESAGEVSALLQDRHTGSHAWAFGAAPAGEG
jgi:MFS family permease